MFEVTLTRVIEWVSHGQTLWSIFKAGYLGHLAALMAGLMAVAIISRWIERRWRISRGLSPYPSKNELAKARRRAEQRTARILVVAIPLGMAASIGYIIYLWFHI